jgi:DNA-binding XRE family transcriptional regulator
VTVATVTRIDQARRGTRRAGTDGSREQRRTPAPEPLWRDALGARLRRIRRRRGRTLAATARRAGISPQYLSEVERGRKDPSSEVVAAVAGALEVSVLEVTTMTVQDLRRSRAGAGSVRLQAGSVPLQAGSLGLAA